MSDTLFLHACRQYHLYSSPAQVKYEIIYLDMIMLLKSNTVLPMISELMEDAVSSVREILLKRQLQFSRDILTLPPTETHHLEQEDAQLK